mmetsp:Transcript_80645/g.250289  ORF Transcript_80645/g.250289 Transcript_80645/m.250289 type:complete len:231 (+) Transcript_80645:44-736(+)
MEWASLACSMTDEVRQAVLAAAAAEEPWQAGALSDQAHAEAVETLERQQKEREEAEARRKAEEDAQAAAAAEAASAKTKEMGENEKAALRAQGLNSRRLPLRPGLPPCAYFMRKGVCKVGRNCPWDHPELELNSLGLPIRPGQPVCALFGRTRTCKFGVLCSLDHPEPPPEDPQEAPGQLPLALARTAAQQHQLQVLLQLQLVQELQSMQEPEAMSDSWAKFRVAFSLSS